MALILNIETATKVCSIALGQNGNLMDYKDLNEANFSHAEKLNLLIVDLLAKNNLKLSEIDAVAISEGPGSYTGLRIGTSTAKGICYGLDIPLVSVNTLESLSNLVKIKDGIKKPMIDARRMEVFTADFDINNNPVSENTNLIVEENSFDNYKETLHLFGNGSDKLKELLSINQNIKFISDIECSARGMVTISEKKFNENNFADVAYFVPDYGKEFYTNVVVKKQ